MKKIILNILIFVFGIFVNVSFSQVAPKATASLDTNTILIGDHVNIKLKLECKKGDKINWPLIRDTITGEVEVISRSGIDTLASQNGLTLSQTITITSFDSGSYIIPPFQFVYGKLNDTTPLYAETNVLILNVNTVVVDTTKAIKDIKPPLRVPLTFREILPYVLGALVLAGIVYLIVYYIRKRRRAEPLLQLKKKPKLPPHEVALKALEDLQKKKLWQSNQIKEYHSELTEIVRIYIEGRFNIFALEMTSGEILESVDNIDVNKEIKKRLKQILFLADLVKFAKEQPLPTEHDQSFSNAVDFVKNTIISVHEATKENELPSEAQTNNNNK